MSSIRNESWKALVILKIHNKIKNQIFLNKMPPQIFVKTFFWKFNTFCFRGHKNVVLGKDKGKLEFSKRWKQPVNSVDKIISFPKNFCA